MFQEQCYHKIEAVYYVIDKHSVVFFSKPKNRWVLLIIQKHDWLVYNPKYMLQG